MIYDNINYTIYNEAMELCKKYDSDTTKVENPYEKGTIEFASWNRGWNSYYNPEWGF